MVYLVVFAALAGVLLLKGIYDNRNYDEKMKKRLLSEFGAIPTTEYTTEKMKSIRAFYEYVQNNEFDVDEITWNDLEMDEVFYILNQTVSAVGEEYLYAMLHQPEYDEAELSERERLISFFETEPEKRVKIQLALHRIGKKRRFSIFSCMRCMKNIRRESNWIHYIPTLLVLASVGLIIVNVNLGVFALCVSICYNFMSYFKRKGEMDAYLGTLSSLVLMLFSTEELVKMELPEIGTYTERMRDLNAHFAKFKKAYFLIGSKKPTGDLLDSVMMYLRMFFHLDLIKFNKMISIYDKYEEDLIEIYRCAGYLDALCAVAGYRKTMGTYCIPEFVESSAPIYEAKALYHPLLSEPVANDINTTRSVLITGSNASGKSTFLKSVALNAILAQTIHTALAQSFRTSRYRIISSMSLRDNLQEHESYFIVEIKSLKRMFDAENGKVFSLCFVDEVLRGTNTVERIAASREILKGLSEGGRLIFAATHDIELTYLLEEQFANYHFEETVTEEEVTFDYLLHEGRATSRNAIKLLGMLGYPDDVIRHAEESAENFLQTGEWN